MKVIVFLLLVMSSPVLSFADSIEITIRKSLTPWNIKSVQHSGSNLTIISGENKVTDQIYRAMIGGICMGYLMEPESLSGITEIQVLNKWKKQGYIFEGGGEECQEYNNLSIKDTKIYILGKTRMH